MEYILTPPILSTIYSYTSYSDLQTYRVSDYVWKLMYDYFCQDAKFRGRIEEFWGHTVLLSSLLSYKSRILHFIEWQVSTCYVRHPPQILLANRDFICNCVDMGLYGIIEDANRTMDAEIVLNVISKDARMLEYTNLKQNKEFVIKAININKYSIMYTPEELRYDPDILYTAARQLCVNLHGNPPELFYQCIVKIITEEPEYFKDLDCELKMNQQLIQLSCVWKYKEFIIEREKYKELYKQNPTWDNALSAIKHGMSFPSLSDVFLNDKNFMRAALSCSPYYNTLISDRFNLRACDTLSILGRDLQKDKSFVLEIIANKTYRGSITGNSILHQDPDMYPAIARYWDEIICYKPELCQNKDLICDILRNNMNRFYDVNSKYKLDIEWCRDVLSRCVKW